MAYLGNQPLLSTMRTVAEGTAYANQTEIPVPGGFVSGMTDVIVGGADLGSGDYDDTNSMSIKLIVPMTVGTMFKVVAWTPNQTVVNAGGQLAGFRNKIINGNFDIWQRGTSLAAAAQYAYLADRWKNSSAGSTIAASQQSFTIGQTALPGEPKFFHRSVVASVAGAANLGILAQYIEGVRTFASQQAVLSFWAKADTAKPMAVSVQQNFGSGGSPSSPVVGIGAVQQNLTTNWQQFRIPITFPSISGKTIGSNGDDNLGVIFWFDAGSNFSASQASGLGQQSGTFDIAQVQLEVGSVATQFEQRPTGLEFSLCQRYYCKSYDIQTAPGTIAVQGAYASHARTTGHYYSPKMTLPQTMRTSPTVVVYSQGSGAVGKVRNISTASDTTPGNSNNSGNFANQSSWQWYASTGLTVDQEYAWHWTADAEL